jgi:PmbA protein
MSDWERTQERLVDLGQKIVERARKAGANVAEAVVGEGSHLSAKARLGAPELVEEAGSRSVGLKVMIGQQVASSTSSDLSETGIARLVEDAIELARLSQPDPFAGPPDASLLSNRAQHVDLDLHDDRIDSIGGGAALEHALNGERAALQYDPRITNSEGATFSRASGARAIVTSGGFIGVSRGTYASLTVHPVADDAASEGKKRSGYYWTAKRHYAGLDPDELVGKEAARRTLAKLGARKVETQQCPVIFDPDVARSIIGLIASSINGGAIWRRSSYLLDRVETRVASELINIVDDPLLLRGSGSRAFDGEGLLSRRNVVVENGVLKTYLLDSYSGRKLGLPSTASASRGGGGGVGPSSTNFILQPGASSPEDILKSTKRGLYVTEMMGFGFNQVTGDFSRGAAGFWVENGEKVFPVSEVTISLNLDKLLQSIDMVGSDLDLRSSIASPTFRVAEMTLAGR